MNIAALRREIEQDPEGLGYAGSVLGVVRGGI